MPDTLLMAMSLSNRSMDALPRIFRNMSFFTPDRNSGDCAVSRNSLTLMVSVSSVTFIRTIVRSFPALVWISLVSRERTCPRITTVPIASVMEEIGIASSWKSLP